MLAREVHTETRVTSRKTPMEQCLMDRVAICNANQNVAKHRCEAMTRRTPNWLDKRQNPAEPKQRSNG
jgi:hypothetical protein